jgi:hypothetical protein
LKALGPEGFRIATLTVAGHQVTVIGSQSEAGALYGVFYYLRLLQTLKPIARLDVSEKPRVQLGYSITGTISTVRLNVGMRADRSGTGANSRRKSILA